MTTESNNMLLDWIFYLTEITGNTWVKPENQMVVMYQCENFEFSGSSVSYVENVFVNKCTLESLKVRVSCQPVIEYFQVIQDYKALCTILAKIL